MKTLQMIRWGFTAGTLLCSMLGTVGAEAPVRGQYRVIDLGRLAGFRSEARGINARGDIAGLTTTDTGYQAARWLWDTTNYVIQALGKGEGYGIADDGTVAGLGDSTGGTLWAPGGAPTSLGLDKRLNAISASGIPVGWISFTVTNPVAPFNVKFPRHAAWFAGTSGIDLAQRPEWDCVVAGVDRTGTRWVGSVLTNIFAGGSTRAWLFPGRDLHTMTNFATSFALAVNSSMQVVGRVNSGPFSQPMYWSEATGMRLLNAPGGTPYGSALGINDAGQAVGALGSGAVLWSHVGRTNETNVFLSDLLPFGHGWTLQVAHAINNRGEIVGYGLSPGGVNAFCLVPTNIVTRTIAGSATVYGHGQAFLVEGLTTNRLERVQVELLVTEPAGGWRVVTNAFADGAGEFAFTVREPVQAVFAVRLTLEDEGGWVSLQHAGVSATGAAWARSPGFAAPAGARADLVWRINEAASPADPNTATAYLNGQPFRVDGPGAAGAAGAGHDEFAALAVMYRNFQLTARFARDELGVTPRPVIVKAFSAFGTYWEPAMPTPRIWFPTNNSWYHLTFERGEIRGGNRPVNREFHEYGHHLMSLSALGMNAFNSVPPRQSHAGLQSYTSAGSWVEGFAEFIGAVIADRMLTADERGRAGSYPCYTARLDLEQPYRLSERSVFFPREATNITHREEFVVAALLWDFYDAPASDPPDAELNELTLDPLHLPLRTLFETITAPAVTDVKELHGALRAYAVAHPAALVPGFVDARFQAAGIYDDWTFDGFDWRNTNGVFNAGETVGITSWNPNYRHRHDATLPNSTWLRVAVTAGSGTPMNGVVFESRSISPPPWDGREITNALTLPGAGPWFVPVVPPPASTAMVVRVSRPGFRAAPEWRLETAWFEQRQNEAGPDEYLAEAEFSLTRATLRAARRADGALEISWPSDVGDVVLEGSSTLPGTVWTTVSTPPTTVGEERRITLAPTDSVRFFRLRAP